MIKSFFLIILVFSCTPTYCATGNLNIIFDLNRPLIVTLNQQPSFGVLAVDASDSSSVTVTLDPNTGVVTSTTTGVVPQTASGAQFGILSVTGQLGKNLAVVLFPSTITLSNGSSKLTLSVTTNPSANTLNNCLLSQTNCSIKLGGSVTIIPSTVATGTYTGTANIILRYVN